MGRDGQLSQLCRLSKWRCRSLRIAFNPNEPKPPTLSPSKIKDFNCWWLIGGGLERRLGLADVPGRSAGVRAAKVFAVVGQGVVREKCLSSFLKRHAHTIGVNGAELFRAPGLGLQWTIRVHLSPAFQVFGIHGLNTLNGDSHHGLVSDLAR